MPARIKVDLHSVLHTLSDISDMRDFITGNHGMRVAILSRAIAERMGLDEEQIEKTYYGGLVHDIGKFAVPEIILQKTTKLNQDEYEIIKRHAYFTAHILHNIVKDQRWQDMIDYASMHHERLDGSGYPNGFKGEQIPLPSRIVAIADMFDVMTARRFYAPRRSMKYVCRELKKEVKAGRIDENVVNTLLDMPLKELLGIIEYDEHEYFSMIQEDKALDNITLRDYCKISLRKKKTSADLQIIEHFEMYYKLEVHKE